MQIVVVGGGAVGLLLASLLQKDHTQIHILVHRESQARELNDKGLQQIDVLQKSHQTYIKVSQDFKEFPTDALWIIAVKYHHLAGLQSLFQSLPKSTPLLFIQNGVMHLQFAKQLHQEHIAFSSVEFGAEKLSDSSVAHRGVGKMKIALGIGNGQLFEPLLQLSKDKLPMEWAENAEQMLTRKALLNCLINPMTTILNVKNGALITNKHSFLLIEQLYKEIMTAFPEQQDQLPFEDVIALCKKTATNTSSMLADRLNGRLMEVDTIVGGILQMAQTRNHEMPILATLHSLLIAMQQGGAES
ncbi:2-dehydropantoate 2-reductase [Viridibacillus sp. YIM B01967]|uniref:2-dehydropantoate 2-reductase n=1 Tax=Viridibacillus soli TaxID=2798301 RepID=A0ABS1H505_9BACL|nr:2-dehydropantoate 2-reductase [Viridibacillus soli]MBK3494499.1 2-dehydropantoate 2-reductase [Viridibacillus soli]